jgi:RNA polymerase sigma-70 factor (ECF subfamily)
MGHQDADLIRRWQRGDAAAFEDLVRRWQQPMARFLARLVGRTDRVQDLCQEVFLRVHLAAPRYSEAGAFSTWLYRIALNVARDAGRRRRHEPGPLPYPEPPAPAPPVETLAAQHELAEAVADAVAMLTPPLREVLVLRHYEGMNFEEMARLLETPASTLKSRFGAALNQLRVCLQQRGWNHEETDA